MVRAHLRRAAPVTAVLFLTTAIAVATPATAQPRITAVTAPKSAPSAEKQRAAVRDGIWRLERSLRHRLDAAGGGNSIDARQRQPTLSELEGLLAVLRESVRQPGNADGAALGRKLEALVPLLREVERRESARGSSQLGASPWDPPASGLRLDGARGSTCAEARAVRDGRFAAAIASHAGATNADLWLRYTAPASGAAVVSTAGSDFDTVVEVYHSCPSAGQAPAARGDDEVGLQARASFRVAKGATSWIRIAGADGATGMAAIQLEGGTGGFEGMVTNEATGLPPSFGFVRVWNAAGVFITSGYIYGDGSYLVSLQPGSYFASTAIDPEDGLLDELYDDLPCAGGPPQGCSVAAGQSITVQGAVLGGIDFDLGYGAAIAGRIRDAGTGELLADMLVNVYGSAGQPVTYAYTDSVGRFLVRGLASGVAFAAAGPQYSALYRRELYQNIGCPLDCDVTAGTPISVTEGQTTPGIDFALDRFGAISGTVTRQANGSPVTYGYVTIWDAGGVQRSYAWTNASGGYLAGGLDAGQYFATTQTWGDFVDEVYDDLPCDPSCDPATGTPVTVALGDVTTGVDFALRRMATISGALIDAVSGDPISFFWDYPSTITLFDASGNFFLSTNSYGSPYEVAGLPAGTYYVKAAHSFYLAELYDDIPCGASCNPLAGTAVTVALDGDATGIDFALTPLGKITGTVVDSATNAPISALVQVWTPSGQFVRHAGTSNGVYEVWGLPDGNYFVTASDAQYAGELYDDVPCPGGSPAGCNLGSGTSVPATLGSTTSGIDFALVRKGRIRGTARDASSMQPLSWARVWVYNSTGTIVASTSTGYDGSYEASALLAGNYFVVADGDYYQDYDAEVFDGLPCPSAACDPTTGTLVPVALDTVTNGIDFALSRSHAITGLVTRPDGTPAPSSEVRLYNGTGSSPRYVWTDSSGHYELPAEPGTWYVLAYGGYNFISQLYSGIPCPDSNCNVTSGTPVTVIVGANTTGIDFALTYARGITGRVTDAGHPLPGVAIDLWNTAGAYVGSTVTGPNGAYHLEPDQGTYFVSTDSGMGAVEELWNNVACPLGPAYAGLCNPLAGTPVTLPSYTSLVNGIDFVLDGVDIFVSGFESGDDGWSASSP